MTNGLVESKNSYILQALRAYCKGQQDDWPELLPGIMMTYRSTPAISLLIAVPSSFYMAGKCDSQ